MNFLSKGKEEQWIEIMINLFKFNLRDSMFKFVSSMIGKAFSSNQVDEFKELFVNLAKLLLNEQFSKDNK